MEKLELADIQRVFQEINVFLKTAIEHGAIIQGFALAAEIGAMVATGKVDKATLSAALTSFQQLNESFATAFAAAQTA